MRYIRFVFIEVESDISLTDEKLQVALTHSTAAEALSEALSGDVKFSLWTAEHKQRHMAMSPRMIEMVDDLSAALDTCLIHYGDKMPEADALNRRKLCDQARFLCDRILRA